MAKELSDYRTLEELNIHDSPRFYVTNKPTVIVSVSLMMGVGCMLLPHVMAKILGLLFIIFIILDSSIYAFPCIVVLYNHFYYN